MPIFNSILIGADTTDATAVADDIIKGKTAYANNEKVTGTLIPAKPDIIDISTATLPSSAYWYSVCYGNGKFVAVAGSSNKAAYSTDGITWTATTMPSSTNWYSVCYGNGKFVAIVFAYRSGSNKAAYSEDGITWTAATLPSSSEWRSVCYGNGKFVAVTYGYDIAAYSTDGITWTETTLPSADCWQSVCYGNGKFVAVIDGGSIAAYSTDGITWTATTMPSSTNWYSVCYGNGKFVAVAYNDNKATYSTDGITWTATTMPSTASWYSVCYGNGKFVVVGGGGNYAAYSTDGINWTETTLPMDTECYSVCYGNGKFVAVISGADKIFVLTAQTPPNYTNWGNARPCDVPEGVTFTSNEGFTLDGTFKPVKPVKPIKQLTYTVVLDANHWDSYYNPKCQSVNIIGVTNDNTQVVMVSPTFDSFAVASAAGVYCADQSSGCFKFKCSTIPTENITMNIVISEPSSPSIKSYPGENIFTTTTTTLGVNTNSFTFEELEIFTPVMAEVINTNQISFEQLQEIYLAEPEKRGEVNDAYFQEQGEEVVRKMNDAINGSPYVQSYADIKVLPLIEPYTYINSAQLNYYVSETGDTQDVTLSILPGVFDNYDLGVEVFIVAELVNEDGKIDIVPFKFVNGNLVGTFSYPGIIFAFWINISADPEEEAGPAPTT